MSESGSAVSISRHGKSVDMVDEGPVCGLVRQTSEICGNNHTRSICWDCNGNTARNLGKGIEVDSRKYRAEGKSWRVLLDHSVTELASVAGVGVGRAIVD